MSAPAPDLQNLYRQIVLDHSRHPRNQRRMEPHDREAEGHNPLCGDKIRVYAQVRDGDLTDIAFEASGCAICVASASLMTEATKGRAGADVRALAGEFERAMTSGAEDLSGDLAALAGVSQYPSRIRCATLPWKTLLAALDASPGTVTTEKMDPSR
ncbi:MAG: SUF system NifU family Fe-S cluster assembly protein [Gemmatimonadota bacterium]|nr:SUF system NifU family Fe-S cluster assembly protein [Gemmatimonadota bacterium]